MSEMLQKKLEERRKVPAKTFFLLVVICLSFSVGSMCAGLCLQSLLVPRLLGFRSLVVYPGILLFIGYKILPELVECVK